MAVSEDLVWLIERLRGARSRRARLRLLIGAWETVRGLSPSDRLVVARELGFEGAERLVEEVAHRQGFDAAPWMEILDGVERSAGREVTDVLRGLADPAHRAETVDRLLEGSGRWVADLESAQPEPHGGGGAVPAESSEDESDVSDAWQEEQPEPVVVAPSPTPGSGAGPAVPDVTAGRAAGTARTPHPVGGTVETAPEKATADMHVVFDIRPAPAAAASVSVDPAISRLVGELAAAPRIAARLRRLDGATGELAGAGHGALVAVLECFPAGWARRRALERLLASGVPSSLADAIALVEELTRPSERLWAFTTLAASRRLDDRERAALLAAAPSPALRRRLGRRQARRQDLDSGI